MIVFCFSEQNREEYNPISEQQRKRQKLVDIRPVELDVDEDEDGAERKIMNFRIFYDLLSIILELFAGETDEEENENEHIDDYDEDEIGDESEEMDESDEIDDDGNDDEDVSEISSEEDDENFLRRNGIKKINQHLGIGYFLYVFI